MKKAKPIGSSDSNQPKKPIKATPTKPPVHWALTVFGEIMCFPLILAALVLFALITRVDPPGLVNFCAFITVGAAILRLFKKPPVWAALMTPAIYTGQLKSGLEELGKGSPHMWIGIYVMLILILGLIFQMFAEWVNRRSNRTTIIIWTILALAYAAQVWFTMQHLAR